MIRALATASVLALIATPCFACPWTQTSSVDTPTATAAAQPAAPAPCPTCVAPGHGSTAPQTAPTAQQPS